MQNGYQNPPVDPTASAAPSWSTVLQKVNVNSTITFQANQGLNKVLGEMVEEGENFLKSFNNNNQNSLIAIDSNIYKDLFCSSLVVVSTSGKEKNGKLQVAYHGILLAITNDPTVPPFQSEGQHKGKTVNYEIANTAQMMLGDDYMTLVEQRIRDQFKGQPIDLYYAQMSTIPPFEEANTKEVFITSIGNALNANAESLNSNDEDYATINVQNLNGSTLSVNFNVNPLNSRNDTDFNGMPTRKDFSITTTIPEANYTRQQRTWSPRQGKVLSSVSGYYDINYNVRPKPNFQPGYHGSNPGFMDCTHFSTVAVITKLDFTQIATTDMLLLAITAATCSTPIDVWVAAMRPKQSGTVDMHNFGGIGTDIRNLTNIDLQNKGVPYKEPTKGQQPGPDDYRVIQPYNQKELTNDFYLDIIDQFFDKGCSLAIDVADAGCDSWMTHRLVEACRTSSQNQYDAYSYFYNVINVMTAGAWSQLVGACDPGLMARLPMGTIMPRAIPMGYYLDAKTQQRCDIRNVDRLAVANVCTAKDYDLLVEYNNIVNTIEADTDPDFINYLYSRLINQIAPHEIVGYGDRIYFRTDFLNKLHQALTQVGFRFQVTRPNPVNKVNSLYDAYYVAGTLLDLTGVSDVFVHSQPDTHSNMRYRRNSFRR